MGLSDLLRNFNLTDGYSQAAVIGLCAVYVFALLLQIIIFLEFGALTARFVFASKKNKITAKDSFDVYKTGAFARAVKSFIKLSEKAVAVTNVKEIVEREYSKISIVFWNVESAERLISALDSALLVITAVLAFLLENKAEIAVVGFGIFIVMRLITSIFDFKVRKSRLIADVSAYIEYEAGQFYASGTASSINMLGNEIAQATKLQTETISSTLGSVSGALKTMVEKTGENVVSLVERMYSDLGKSFSDYDDYMKRWRSAIDEGIKLQEHMNTSADKLALSQKEASKLNNAIIEAVGKFSLVIEQQSEKTGELVKVMEASSSELIKSNASVELVNSALSEQLKIVRENQKTLETTVAGYELAVSGMAEEMGNALGKIIDYHAKSAYDSIGNEMSVYVKQVFEANNELILRLEAMFDRIREQNRAEAVALISMKEQMDLQFEAIRKESKD